MKKALKESLFDKNLFIEVDNEIRLRGSECENCGKIFFPPQRRCTECLQSDLSVKALDTEGTLYSYTQVHIPSRNFKPPYTVGYVELGHGVRVFAQIRTGKVESLKIGLAVRMVIDYLWKDAQGQNVSGYIFEPAGGQETSISGRKLG